MSKQPLLLLHGALGTKNEFDNLIPKLGNGYELHRLNFEGHGENRQSAALLVSTIL